MLEKLDPLLHNQIRLGIISLLTNVDYAKFKFLQQETGATAGNLSIQVKKLNEAKYITVEKSFRDNYPLTTCRLTSYGREAFEKYVQSLRGYIS
jgi:DNA-binding MarR family transcriptional regulator